jgi:uncharacterized protein YdeI (YjbR/CyaY-like superfamily)
VKPVFFTTPAAYRAWLRKHHATETELWIGFYKKASRKPSITYQEALDESLCYGWIDGLRRSRDAESYVQRFTPRRRTSVWSAINIRRVAELTLAKRMRPAGLAIFNARDPRKVQRYSFEQETTVALSPAARRTFRANKTAWAFFDALPPGHRRMVTFWVMSAKKEETRARRLEQLIAASAAGRRLT